MIKKILSVLCIMSLLAVLVFADNSGDGFVLKKGAKPIYNLESQYDGQGWGVGYRNTITLPFRNGYLKQIKVVTKGFLGKMAAIHMKDIKTPLTYKNFESFDSVEVLNTLKDSQIKQYELKFRVPSKKFKENSTTVIYQTKEDQGLLLIQDVKCNKDFCDFKVVSQHQGTYTVGNQIEYVIDEPVVNESVLSE